MYLIRVEFTNQMPKMFGCKSPNLFEAKKSADYIMKLSSATRAEIWSTESYTLEKIVEK